MCGSCRGSKEGHRRHERLEYGSREWNVELRDVSLSEYELGAEELNRESILRKCQQQNYEKKGIRL
jgi:hypothetical protein